MRGDFKDLPGPPAADGAEPCPLGPHVVGPALDQSLNLVRSGIGGEVKVRIGQCSRREQGVADGATYQVQRLIGLGETLRQPRGGGQQRLKSLGHGGGRHLSTVVGLYPLPVTMRWARTALCTSAVSMLAFLALGSSLSSATAHVSDQTQSASAPALTLAAQSPFIEPTGPWFHMTVNVGDRQVAASQLRVTFTFYSRIEAISELQQANSGPPDENALNRVPISSPITVNGNSRTASICVTVLPNPSVTAPPAPAGAAAAEACPTGAPIVYLNCVPGNGTCGQVHPLSVALQRVGSSDDVSRFTTFLTYQEPTVEGTGPLRVAMVMPVGPGGRRRPRAPSRK